MLEDHAGSASHDSLRAVHAGLPGARFSIRGQPYQQPNLHRKAQGAGGMASAGSVRSLLGLGLLTPGCEDLCQLLEQHVPGQQQPRSHRLGVLPGDLRASVLEGVRPVPLLTRDAGKSHDRASQRASSQPVRGLPQALRLEGQGSGRHLQELLQPGGVSLQSFQVQRVRGITVVALPQALTNDLLQLIRVEVLPE